MKKPLLYAIIYSTLVIAFKLYVFYSGQLMGSLGYFSHIISLLFMTPFCYVLVKQIRDKERNGHIGGREALKQSMTFVAISIVLLSVFNYVFYEMAMGQYIVDYITANGPAGLRADAIKHNKPMTDAEIAKSIQAQIASLSAFADTTLKVISMVAYGLFSSFIVAVFLKK